ncbi:MAG: GntR family transcriptional regulator, partial [Deltaproteobacteria bacterium]|nr:GntR family transcriptional regulator [Deltaproteobacteria bacterium]
EIHRLSLSDQAYDYIKRLILSGEIRGGERIPEEKVAQRFGVSRTPIREAISRLEEYGLVQIKPRAYAEVVALEPHEAGQLAVIRAQLETLAVSLLTDCGTEEDFRELDLLAKECNDAVAEGDIATTFERDSQLHLETARRTGNRHLYEICEKLDAKIQLLRLVLRIPRGKLIGYVKHHDGIIAAMRSRDKELAIALMKHHVMNQLNDQEMVESAEAGCLTAGMKS